MTVQTFIITTVPNPEGAGAIYQVDGQNRPILNFIRGGVYTFNQSSSSNTNHPIAFKDGTGAAYTVGVVSTGVSGQPGAQTVITVASNAPNNLRYYCVTHGNNMGNVISVTDANSIQTINLGNRVNDGLGDDLRTAFQKVNANFANLSIELTVSAQNLGSAGIGLFKQKNGSILEFKRLQSGSGIALDEFEDSVAIRSTADIAFTRFDTDAGTIIAGVGNVNGAITLRGTSAPNSVSGVADIEVTALGSQVLFKNIVPVTDILTTYDFGSITGSFTNSVQMALAAANIDFGTINLPGRFDLDMGSIV